MCFHSKKKKENEETLALLKEARAYLSTQPKVVCSPYPDYDGRVMRALSTLEDTDYLADYEKLDPEATDRMTLREIATMYTFILRGERFSDGHIATYIENGSLLRLVDRHISLLEK